MKIRASLVAATAFAGLLAATPAEAKTNILFILDASNSMWGQLDGVAKIETAKETLAALVGDLPADTSVALMAYGHRQEGACDDVETMAAFGTADAAGIVAKIQGIRPKGKTPIAFALAQSADAFGNRLEDNNHIVLISDGIESCNGDPCAAAARLNEMNFKVRAHVVGFGLTKEEGASLNCIAEETGGRYFDAANTEAFKTAVTEVTQIAQADPEPVTPPPAPKEPSELMKDDFDGSELGDNWEVIHPNPDQFIVENGEILVVYSDEQDPANDNVTNMFRWTGEMPTGDWVITMKYRTEYQTFRERAFVGVMTDAQNYILAQSNMGGDCCSTAYFKVWGVKNAGGEITQFVNTSTESKKGSSVDDFRPWAAQRALAEYLRLEKQGRNYIASVMVQGTAEDGSPKAEWQEVQKLTSLRMPKSLVFGFSQIGSGHSYVHVNGGESISHVDWIKLEVKE